MNDQNHERALVWIENRFSHILPGDMKNLMNKVTKARKAAEANLIARREEAAAMRS